MAGPIPIKTSKPCPPQFLRHATSSVRYRMHGGTRTGPRTPEDLTRSPESKFRKVISRENISLKTCGSRSEDFPFQPNGPQNVDWLGTLRANEPVDHFFRRADFSLDSTYLNLHLGHTTGVSIIASVPYRADEASNSTISTATTKLANGTYQRLHESLSAHGGASL